MQQLLRRSLIALAPIFLSTPASGAPATEEAHAVLFVIDDLSPGDLRYMPHTRRLLVDEGMALSNALVTYGWCCPSRASIFRGQYAHNTLIFDNGPGDGGYKKFYELGLHEDNLFTRLQDAGTHTAAVGKYLNYQPFAEYPALPPGIERGAIIDYAYAGYNYEVLTEDGIVTFEGPDHYLHDVLRDYAVLHASDMLAAGGQSFLYVAPLYPHSPQIPAKRHEHLFQDTELVFAEPQNETDRENEPEFFRRLAPLSPELKARMADEYRRRLRSLQSVDEMIRDVVSVYEKAGVLDRTYFLLISDNGMHLAGEYGLTTGKNQMIEEDLHVPAFVRGPRIEPGSESDALVANIDLFPTIAAALGVEAPAYVDGRSILPLIAGDASTHTREVLKIERVHQEEMAFWQAELSGMPRELIERSAPAIGLVVGDRWFFAEYLDTGEMVLRDRTLTRGPNLIPGARPENVEEPALAAFVSELSARVHALDRCESKACRTLEDLPLDSEPQQLVTQASVQ
jgi:arylsulfatase A-like enzyme